MVADRFDIDTYRVAIGLAMTGILSIAAPEAAAAVRDSSRRGVWCRQRGERCALEQPGACCSRCCCTVKRHEGRTVGDVCEALGALGSVVTMTEAIWCVAYGLLWWWVALMLPDHLR